MHYSTPEGLESLLSLAAAHEDFARELIARRGALAAAAKVSLRPTERAMLDSLSDQRLGEMIAALRRQQPDGPRRSFLRHASTALLVLASGGITAACKDSAPKVPIRIRMWEGKLVHTKGIRPDSYLNVPRSLRPLYKTPAGAPLEGALAGQRIALRAYRVSMRGPLSRTALSSALAKHAPELCAWYLSVYPDPHPGGASLSILMSVKADGRVTSVRIIESTIRDTNVLNGLENTLETLRFGKEKEGSGIRFELHFRVGK